MLLLLRVKVRIKIKKKKNKKEGKKNKTSSIILCIYNVDFFIEDMDGLYLEMILRFTDSLYIFVKIIMKQDQTSSK